MVESNLAAAASRSLLNVLTLIYLTVVFTAGLFLFLFMMQHLALLAQRYQQGAMIELDPHLAPFHHQGASPPTQELPPPQELSGWNKILPSDFWDNLIPTLPPPPPPPPPQLLAETTMESTTSKNKPSTTLPFTAIPATTIRSAPRLAITTTGAAIPPPPNTTITAVSNVDLCEASLPEEWLGCACCLAVGKRYCECQDSGVINGEVMDSGEKLYKLHMLLDFEKDKYGDPLDNTHFELNADIDDSPVLVKQFPIPRVDSQEPPPRVGPICVYVRKNGREKNTAEMCLEVVKQGRKLGKYTGCAQYYFMFNGAIQPRQKKKEIGCFKMEIPGEQ